MGRLIDIYLTAFRNKNDDSNYFKKLVSEIFFYLCEREQSYYVHFFYKDLMFHNNRNDIYDFIVKTDVFKRLNYFKEVYNNIPNWNITSDDFLKTKELFYSKNTTPEQAFNDIQYYLGKELKRYENKIHKTIRKYEFTSQPINNSIIEKLIETPYKNDKLYGVVTELSNKIESIILNTMGCKKHILNNIEFIDKLVISYDYKIINDISDIDVLNLFQEPNVIGNVFIKNDKLHGNILLNIKNFLYKDIFIDNCLKNSIEYGIEFLFNEYVDLLNSEDNDIIKSMNNDAIILDRYKNTMNEIILIM